MNFIAELKRRNVIRMAGLYLVGAWLVVQVSSTVLPMFNAPAWLPRSIVVVLAIGFVPMLVLSWVFELTPDGIKRDDQVRPEESIAPQTARRMDRSIIVVLLLALAYFGFDKFVLAPRRDAAQITQAAQSVAQAVPRNSIAVMPFLNLSGDPKQEYFSDGMTEEILNALANVPRLEVTARTSVFSLKGQRHDVREIGKMLDVAYILEGSVRQADGEVRITAQLIRTDNGFHLWSHDYDRKLEHVFALQADVASDIAQALKLPLGIGGDAALVSQRTDDPQAYALYLKARAAYRQRGEGVQHSIDLYHAALARDPKFAPAWAGLCGSFNVLPYYLPEGRKSEIPRIQHDGEAACNQAIALAPDLASAHIMLGNLYTNEWRWKEAEQHFQRAQALAPNDPEFYFAWTDWLGSQGRVDEALQAAQRAVTLDPMAPMYRNLYGYLLSYSGRNDECVAQMEAGYALAPRNKYINRNLFICYVEAGRIDDAEKLRDSIRDAFAAGGESAAAVAKQVAISDAIIAIARNPGQYAAISDPLGKEGLVGRESLIMASVFPSHVDDLFRYAEDGIDKHDVGSDPVVLLRSPLFAKFRDDPRYLRLLHKAGFDDAGNIRNE
jgi:TolB-like protein/Flp pilus assembly protein TadD